MKDLCDVSDPKGTNKPEIFFVCVGVSGGALPLKSEVPNPNTRSTDD